MVMGLFGPPNFAMMAIRMPPISTTQTTPEFICGTNNSRMEWSGSKIIRASRMVRIPVMGINNFFIRCTVSNIMRVIKKLSQRHRAIQPKRFGTENAKID